MFIAISIIVAVVAGITWALCTAHPFRPF